MRLSLKRNITQSQRDVMARRRTFQHSSADAIQVILYLVNPMMLERSNGSRKCLGFRVERDSLFYNALSDIAAVVNDKQHGEPQSQHHVDGDKKLRPDRPWMMSDHGDNAIVSLIRSQATASNFDCSLANLRNSLCMAIRLAI